MTYQGALFGLAHELEYGAMLLHRLRIAEARGVELEWFESQPAGHAPVARLRPLAAEHAITIVPHGAGTDSAGADDSAAAGAAAAGGPGEGLQSAWQSAAFMALDVLYPAEHNGTLLLHFFVRGDSEPRFNVRFGLFPQLRTRITFPLRVLDGQTIYLPRTSGRLKGVCQGHRIARQELSHVTLSLVDVGQEQTLFFSNMALLTEEPPYPMPEQPLVDQLGQWTAKQWSGKTRDEPQLKERLNAELAHARGAAYPGDWSRFGGTIDKRFEAGGFFRTEYSQGRWWLVDPHGYAFWSAGLDCVRPGEAAAIVPGTERLFSELPPRDGVFAAAWRDNQHKGTLSVDFPLANLIRAFGTGWLESWQQLAGGRLKQWRFNTVANWSDVELARRERIPFVIQLPQFPSTETKLFRDFPDVFDPAYEQSARDCAQALHEFRDEEYLVGYFLTNEPHWAFGEFNLASEMLEQNPGTHTRRALADWLRCKYNRDAAAWSRAWSVDLTDFAQMESDVFHRLGETAPGACGDLFEYSKLMVRRYIETACAATREVDAQHLNLGMRYAWVSSELCYEGGECFDVFSINNYSMEPPHDAIARVMQRIGRPTIIGEYHFGATDRGLPASGLRRVASQQERAVAYRYYVESCASDPNIVGAHYFILNDQALLGRFDGENYQIGLVDCCHTPYAEFVDGVRAAHERMYDVRQGRVQPSARRAVELPRLF